MTDAGSLEDLKAVIQLLHLAGHWLDEGSFHTFACDNGDHINFWPETGELQVKGHPDSSRALAQKLEQVLNQPGQ